MESYNYCVFLVLFSFTVVPTSSQRATGECNAFEAGIKNFYNITKLRQFPGQEPLWVKIKDEELYYNLNGATFKIENSQKDDVAAHGVNRGRKTWEIEDASQNKLSRNQTNAYVFLKRRNRWFEIKFDDSDVYNFYEDYSAVLEPHAQVAFMLKKANSPTQHGKLFWLAFKQPPRDKDTVVAHRVAFFDGTVISMDIDGPANKIILATKKDNIGIVYLLQHSSYNPCTKFNIENVALKFVRSSYNAFKKVVLNEGAIKCENYRLDLPVLEERERSACKVLSDYENNMNENGIKSINALIDEKKTLLERLNKQKVLVQDANTKLHKLLSTAVLNKRTVTPAANSVFSEKLMTSEIDEYVSHNYVCVLKDELDKGEKELDIGTQMSYLKDALLMVNKDLEVMTGQY